MKQNIPIIVLAGVFLALATLYSAAIPLGEGPDEPGHADYAFFLARTGRLPVQRLDSRQADVPGEGHQPPLAYALAAPLALWLPRDERRTDTIGNPRFVWNGGAEPNAISHGSREYLPWEGSMLAWHLMRLISVVCGAATVFFTYLAARELDFRAPAHQSNIQNPKSGIPLLAAGLVAFNPQFLFVAALVTNDALLAALSAAVLWLIVRTKNPFDYAQGGREPRTPEQTSGWTANNRRRIREVMALGIVLGLALLTKQSAIVLVPVALLALVARRGDERTKPAIAETGVRTGGTFRVRLVHPFTRLPAHLLSLLNAALLIAAVALVAGWWYARNQRLYGDLFGLAAFRGEFATQPFQISDLTAWIAALVQLHSSFWARFGWMNVMPPAWALWPIGAIEVAAMGGLVSTAIRARRADRWSVVACPVPRPAREPPCRRGGRWPPLSLSHVGGVIGHWALLAIPALALAWMVSFAVTAGLVAWQGRLLFPALPAIAILLARGLAAWGEPSTKNQEPRTENQNKACPAPRQAREPRRRREQSNHELRTTRDMLVIGVVLCPLLLLAVWMPENVIRPAYPPQTLPEPVALAQAGNSVVFRFRRRGERSITLRGWRLAAPARPGALLDLTLTWYASGRQVRNWVVFVALVDEQGRTVAEDHGEPRDGLFPTTQWNPGDWIEDRRQVLLPANLAGKVYTLRIWLQDTQNNQRAEVRIDETRPLGNTLDLGSIIVEGGG